MPLYTNQLASLLGLDDETVNTQIVPYIESLTSSTELELHLRGLLGDGPSQESFIKSYVTSRFPHAPAPPSPARGHSRSTPPPSQTPAGTKPLPQKLDAWGRPITLNRQQQRQAALQSNYRPASVSSASQSGASSPNGPRSKSGRNTPTAGGAVDTKELEAAFGGGSGSVYVKGMDDAGSIDFVGPKGTRKSGTATPTSAAAQITTSSSSSFSSRPAAPTQPPSRPPSQPNRGSSSNPRQSPAPSSSLTIAIPAGISPAAQQELTEIARSLRILGLEESKGKAAVKDPKNHKEPGCFCQTRHHPLNRFVSICTRCGLVLCSRQKPMSPCPSCSKHRLLSDLIRQSHLSSLQSRRESILERERSRIQAEEEERRREKFPVLGQGNQLAPNLRNYSERAGGGPDIYDRINRAYAVAQERDRESKVLRLDTKSKTVKIQTKVRKRENNVGGKTSEGADTVELDLDDDIEEGEAWIDEEDDRFRGRQESRRIAAEKPPASTRPYLNKRLDADARPTYVPAPPPTKVAKRDGKKGATKRERGTVPGAGT